MKNEMKSRGGTEDELFDTVTRTLKLAGINLRKKTPKTCKFIQTIWIKGAQWLSGRVLDSRLRGGGFEPHRRHCVVSLSKNINSSLVLVQPRKTRPCLTERLLMGRKESNQTDILISILKIAVPLSKIPKYVDQFREGEEENCPEWLERVSSLSPSVVC